jgi:hypothetical protein
MHFPAKLGLWACFMLGMGVYILIRASLAVRAKTNPLKSRSEFFYLSWDIILFRGIIEAMLFWTFASYPEVLIPSAETWGFGWIQKIPTTVPPVVFFIGLAIDGVFDFICSKIPKLNRIPHLPESDE